MKKKAKDNRLQIIFVVAILAIALFFLFMPNINAPNVLTNATGQSPTDTSDTTFEATRVVQLSTVLPRARNFDTDKEKDGVDVIISPKDVDGNLVQTNGVVNARLWLSISVSGDRTKGELIETWTNLPISASGYGDYGYKVILPFKDYVPQQNDYGFFEVTLTTPDGKKFAAEEVLLSLGIIA